MSFCDIFTSLRFAHEEQRDAIYVETKTRRSERVNGETIAYCASILRHMEL